MNKFILGSGIEALLTRDLLGSDWKIVSPGKFNKNILIGEYLIYDERIDDYIFNLMGNKDINYLYSAISVNGDLLYNNLFFNNYLSRIYNNDVTIYHISSVFKELVQVVYNHINIYRLYDTLSQKYTDITYSKNIKIQNHKLIIDNIEYEYDRIINTLPLHIFNKIFNMNIEHTSYDATIVLCGFSDEVESDVVYVLDAGIPFHKFMKWNGMYVLFFVGKINEEPKIIYNILHNLEIYSVYTIDNYYHEFNLVDHIDDDIYMVGRHARNDDAMTISDVVLNLMKLKA